ncbi:hypothetical protein EDB19DRAFT_1768502 [Suillus lakei]|nr:hypothetical protein EDB19DRAFT_1768502 [Suillus lakei]
MLHIRRALFSRRMSSHEVSTTTLLLIPPMVLANLLALPMLLPPLGLRDDVSLPQTPAGSLELDELDITGRFFVEKNCRVVEFSNKRR